MPKEWLAEDLSEQYVADYKAFNFVDGEGSPLLAALGAHSTVQAVIMWRHKIFIMDNRIHKNWKIRLQDLKRCIIRVDVARW